MKVYIFNEAMHSYQEYSIQQYFSARYGSHLYPLKKQYWKAGVLCNVGYPSETHLKLKSRGISFAHNLFPSYKSLRNFAQIMAEFLND